MSDGLGFLTAVYRDGRVHIGGKSYPAGTFAAQLLNQYYKDDTAARIAVFRQSNWNVQEQLCAGYLNETDFIKAGKEILTILQTLPKLKPFSSLDIAAEKQRIAELFTEGNAAALSDYLRRRAAISRYMPVLLPTVPGKANNSRPAIRTTDRFCHQTCIFPYSYPPFCNLEFLGFFL